MAIKIEIYTTYDPHFPRPEREQIEESLSAIGFVPRTPTLREISNACYDNGIKLDVSIEPKEGPREPTPGFEVSDIVAEQKADVEEAKAATQRQRGQPSPGKARRTKAEIAEDEAADKVDDAAEAQGGYTQRMTDAFTAEQQAISSGDERLSPDDEQDAADEAREAAANKTDDALTHEDLRKALADYSKKHGMKAAVAAVKEGGIIGCTVDKVALDDIEGVIELLKGDVQAVADAPAKEPEIPQYPATKDGLKSAMIDYAIKYDGTDDISKASMQTMPATMTDCPKIFQMRFGEAVNSLSKVPEDGYAQAIADVQEATAKNPFSRGVK